MSKERRYFLSFLYDYILNSYFWEDGRVMIITSIIVSFLLRLLFKYIAKSYAKKHIELAPYLLYSIGMLFGGIMIFFPNGTGGVTQHFYLGVLMYSLTMFVFATIFSGIGKIVDNVNGQ